MPPRPRRTQLALLATSALALTVAPGLTAASEAAMPTTPFISEIHYDNASTDVGEFVEVQIPAGTQLRGAKVVLYNGSGGASYGTLDLPTVIGPGRVARGRRRERAFHRHPERRADGLALVRADGTAIEFLSYEGTFAATNGAALGMTATDIGVSEADTDPCRAVPVPCVQRRPRASSSGTLLPPTPAVP